MKTLINTVVAGLILAVCLGSFCLLMKVEQATAQNIQTIILDLNK